MSVRFSILMAVYNREKYLREAIDSVLSQTFASFELIAIDDGSTDGSLAVLKSYGNRIKLLQQPNQGPEVARNSGAAVAEGEYIVILDSDDFFFPFALETFDRVIREFDSPPVITGSIRYFRDGQKIPAEEFVPTPIRVLKYKDYISKSLPLATNSIIMRKSVYDDIGGMRNSTPKTFHNEDMNLLLKAGTHSPFIVIQEPATSAYRLHGENSIGSVKAIADGMLRIASAERQGQYPGGSQRRWDRYAIIGGRSSTWALRYCWHQKQRMLALKLLFGTAPMVLAAVVKRTTRIFRKPPQSVTLPSKHREWVGV